MKPHHLVIAEQIKKVRVASHLVYDKEEEKRIIDNTLLGLVGSLGSVFLKDDVRFNYAKFRKASGFKEDE